MPKRSPIPLAYKLRTATMATEYKGTHAGGLELLFVSLPDALARRKMIDALEKVHAKMLARESGPELDGDQQTAAQVAALGHQVHPDSALPSLTPEGHAARLATQPGPIRYERTVGGAPLINRHTGHRDVAQEWKRAGYAVTPDPDAEPPALLEEPNECPNSAHGHRFVGGAGTEKCKHCGAAL